MMHDLGLKATHRLTQQKGACRVLQINSSAGKVHDRPWKSKLARIRASGSFQKSRASQKNQSIEASSEKCIFNSPIPGHQSFGELEPTQPGTAPLRVQLYTAAPRPHHGPIHFARWDQEPPPSWASDKGSWPCDTGRGLSAYFRTIDPNCTFLDWRAPFSCRLFALGILIRDWRIQIIQMFHRLELRLDAKGTRWWFITDIFIKLLDKLCTLSNSRVIASRVARLLCTGNSTFQLVL